MNKNSLVALGRVLIIGLLFFGNGFAQSKKQKSKSKPFVTKEEVWIDRFDEPKGVALNKEVWYTVNDTPNGGFSQIVPSEIVSAYDSLISRKGDNVLRFQYSLDQGSYKWEPYIGFGVPIFDSTLAVSLAKIEGVAYDYIGARHYVNFQTSSVKDYAHFKRMVPESEAWKTMIIPISEFRQPNSWGRQVVFDSGLIQALSWNIIGRTGDTGTICIDNVRLLRKLPPEPEIKKEVVVAPKKLKITKAIVREVSDKVAIADWYGFRKAAYSLSFDDGLASQYKYVGPLLDKYNMKATFYIVSESLEKDSLKPASWKFGHWYQFLDLQKRGHELAAHTATHAKLTGLDDGPSNAKGTLQYELDAPVNALKSRISNYQPVTFAYPFGDFNLHVMDESAKVFASTRGLGSGFNPKTPSQWMNLQSHDFMYGPNRTLVSDKEKSATLSKWVAENTIVRKGWSIFLAHDVFPYEEAIKATDSWQPVSLESLEAYLTALKSYQDNNELWIETVGNVTRYVKERDAMSVVLKEETKIKMIFSVTDPLPNEMFDFPVSIAVNVPADWNVVKMTQGGRSAEVKSVEGKVQWEVIPDTGDLVLEGK